MIQNQVTNFAQSNRLPAGVLEPLQLPLDSNIKH